MIEKCEPASFFDADAPGANVLVRKRGSGDLGGTLIFLPDADLNREMELFAEAAFFKGGNHENGMANARDHKAHEPLPNPPPNPREDVKGTARGRPKRGRLSTL